MIVKYWQRFWFYQVPPHIYSLLRILFGLMGCLTLLGIRDLGTFWDLSGLVPAQGGGFGLKAFLLASGLGDVAGRVLFFGSFTAYVAMTLGLYTSLAVPLALVASLTDLSWNYLPHSGAYLAVEAILFCLIWADCGAVWSIDAWLRRLERQGTVTYAIAPLRLIRLQVGLIYFSTGIRKLHSEHWRDGSAVHYVLGNNIFRRFPQNLPPGLDPIATLLTYVVLVWELAFLFLIPFRPARRVVLTLGVLLHLGMQATLEIGPFAWVMLASYAAFLDPHTVATLPYRITKLVAWRGSKAGGHDLNNATGSIRLAR